MGVRCKCVKPWLRTGIWEFCREQQEDPKNRTIARLLMDAPALPQPAVATFLADVAAGSGEWASLALQVMHPPSSQTPCAFQMFWFSSTSGCSASKEMHLLPVETPCPHHECLEAVQSMVSTTIIRHHSIHGPR